MTRFLLYEDFIKSAYSSASSFSIIDFVSSSSSSSTTIISVALSSASRSSLERRSARLEVLLRKITCVFSLELLSLNG